MDIPLNAYAEEQQQVANYTAWKGVRTLPKFNTSNPGVRDYLFQVVRYWLDFGIDGWRLDAPEEITDDSFWQELRIQVKSGHPDAYIVGRNLARGAPLAARRYVRCSDELCHHRPHPEFLWR